MDPWKWEFGSMAQKGRVRTLMDLLRACHDVAGFAALQSRGYRAFFMPARPFSTMEWNMDPECIPTSGSLSSNGGRTVSNLSLLQPPRLTGTSGPPARP